jgi:CheY-like chemotaxis protein
MRVLAVDDNADVLAGVGKLLEVAGHKPLLAQDAETAVALCRQTTPDFVLLDIKLPGMDGYSLAETLRTECELTNVQMWAFSAYADDPTRRRQSGIVGHIQKPLSFAHIQHLIGVARP